MVDISFLRRYCRTDTTDDTFLSSLAESAEEELKAQGVYENNGNAAIYRLTVAALVLHWLDHPGGEKYPEGLDKRITTLRQTQIKGVV